MTDDLIAFLRARLDEDEAAAKKADEMGNGVWALAPHFHTARHSPARVLREVAAKRCMLTDVKGTIDGLDAMFQQDRGVGHYTTSGESDELLKLLALPYSDHPDYRDEWALDVPPHR